MLAAIVLLDLHTGLMPKKHPKDLHESAKFWGSSEAIETRLRKLANEVRALRLEMADDRKRHRLGHERLSGHADGKDKSRGARSRKRDT